MVTADEWAHPYSRRAAAFPAGDTGAGTGVRGTGVGGPDRYADKYWPPVRRIDQAAGDRNLVCSCPPISAYES
jgi:glycine dehydrogenase